MADSHPALADEPDWVLTQLKTFGGWAQTHLDKRDLKFKWDEINGYDMVVLLEEISGADLGKVNKKPRMKFHKLENIKVVFDYIEDVAELKLIGISPEALIEPNLKSILGFLWILILRWLIREYIGEVDADGKKVTPKEAMLLWVAEETGVRPTKNGSNLHEVLRLLIDKLEPTALSAASFSGDDEADLDYMFGVARDTMNIPALLDASDVLGGRIDDLSLITYLSYYRKYEVVELEASGRIESLERRRSLSITAASPTAPPTAASLPTFEENVTFGALARPTALFGGPFNAALAYGGSGDRPAVNPPRRLPEPIHDITTMLIERRGGALLYTPLLLTGDPESANAVMAIKAIYDRDGECATLDEYEDAPLTLVTVLREYLAELPASLLAHTPDTVAALEAAADEDDGPALAALVADLSEPRQAALHRVVLLFLMAISEQRVNDVTAAGVSISWAAPMQVSAGLVRALIDHYGVIFAPLVGRSGAPAPAAVATQCVTLRAAAVTVGRLGASTRGVVVEGGDSGLVDRILFGQAGLDSIGDDGASAGLLLKTWLARTPAVLGSAKDELESIAAGSASPEAKRDAGRGVLESIAPARLTLLTELFALVSGLTTNAATNGLSVDAASEVLADPLACSPAVVRLLLAGGLLPHDISYFGAPLEVACEWGGGARRVPQLVVDVETAVRGGGGASGRVGSGVLRRAIWAEAGADNAVVDPALKAAYNAPSGGPVDLSLAGGSKAIPLLEAYLRSLPQPLCGTEATEGAEAAAANGDLVHLRQIVGELDPRRRATLEAILSLYAHAVVESTHTGLDAETATGALSGALRCNERTARLLLLSWSDLFEAPIFGSPGYHGRTRNGELLAAPSPVIDTLEVLEADGSRALSMAGLFAYPPEANKDADVCVAQYDRHDLNKPNPVVGASEKTAANVLVRYLGTGVSANAGVCTPIEADLDAAATGGAGGSADQNAMRTALDALNGTDHATLERVIPFAARYVGNAAANGATIADTAASLSSTLGCSEPAAAELIRNCGVYFASSGGAAMLELDDLRRQLAAVQDENEDLKTQLAGASFVFQKLEDDAAQRFTRGDSLRTAGREARDTAGIDTVVIAAADEVESFSASKGPASKADGSADHAGILQDILAERDMYMRGDEGLTRAAVHWAAAKADHAAELAAIRGSDADRDSDLASLRAELAALRDDHAKLNDDHAAAMADLSALRARLEADAAERYTRNESLRAAGREAKDAPGADAVVVTAVESVEAFASAKGPGAKDDGSPDHVGILDDVLAERAVYMHGEEELTRASCSWAAERAELEELRVLVADWESKHSAAAGEAGELRVLLADWEAKHGDLSTQHSELFFKHEDLASEHSTKIGRIGELEADLVTWKSKYATLEGRVGDKSEALSAMEDEVQRLTVELAGVRDELATMTDSRDATEVRLTSAEADKGALEASLGEAREEISGLEILVADWESKNNAKETRIAELERELAAWQAKHDGLQAEHASLTSDHAVAGGQAAELQAANAALLERYRRDVWILSFDRSGSDDPDADINAAVERGVTRKAEIEAELDDLRASVVRWQAKYEALETASSDKSAQLQAANAELAELKDRHATQTAELENLHRVVVEWEAKHSGLSGDIGDLERQVLEWETRHASLEQDLASKHAEVSSLADAHDEKQTALMARVRRDVAAISFAANADDAQSLTTLVLNAKAAKATIVAELERLRRLEVEHGDLVKTHAALESTLSAAHARVAAMEAQLFEAQSVAERLTAAERSYQITVETMEKDHRVALAALRAESADVRAKYQAVLAERDGCFEDRQALEADLAERTAAFAEERADFESRFRDEVIILSFGRHEDAETQTLNEAIVEAKAAKQATQDKLEDLKRLRLTNEELRGSIVDRDGRISELSGEKATLEQELITRRRRFLAEVFELSFAPPPTDEAAANSLTSAILAAKLAKADIERELERLRAEHAALQQGHDDLRDRHDQIARERDETEAQYAERLAKYKRAAEKHRDRALQHAASVENLNAELEAERARQEELVRVHSEAVLELHGHRSQLTEELSTLQRQTLELDTRHASTRDKLKDLKRQLKLTQERLKKENEEKELYRARSEAIEIRIQSQSEKISSLERKERAQRKATADAEARYARLDAESSVEIERLRKESKKLTRRLTRLREEHAQCAVGGGAVKTTATVTTTTTTLRRSESEVQGSSASPPARDDPDDALSALLARINFEQHGITYRRESSGVYVFGTTRITVRVVNGAVMVRYNGEWITFEQWLEIFLRERRTVSEDEALKRRRQILEARAQLDALKPAIGVVVEAYKNSNRGVRVARVIEGKPAEAAGILEEDMIHRIGDVEVHSHPDFRKALKLECRPGEPSRFYVEREGELLEMMVQIGGAGLTVDELHRLMSVAALDVDA